MIETVFSLLPPVIAIVMVLLTRRVLLSLGVGILSAAVLLGIDAAGNGGEFVSDSASSLWGAVSGVFYSVGEGGFALNTWNLYILGFLLLLGITTAFMSMNGGIQAFGVWALNRVKTRAGAQIVTFMLGIAIFIDDYFNSLAVGQVAKPITDGKRIARARLAYLIDSTAAPICVIAPLSSWGAYIISILGTDVIAKHSLNESELGMFLATIPANLYVWTALLLVLFTSIWSIGVGPMRKHEELALRTGTLFDEGKDVPGETGTPLPTSDFGKIGALVYPIASLFVFTVGALIYSGATAGGSFAPLSIFENADSSFALFIGGSASAVVAALQWVGAKLPGHTFLAGLSQGSKSMLPAVYILIFAWTIAALIGELGTGGYLAGLIQDSAISSAWLPVLLFLVAGFMAFATGTSWGSFAILLPIAGDILVAVDVELLVPALAAVLAGSVLGDHCSPISDTTILSSTGAGSNHIDHVVTQLPYALIGGGISVIGFILMGFTGSVWLTFVVTILLTFLVLGLLRRKYALREEAVQQV